MKGRPEEAHSHPLGARGSLLKRLHTPYRAGGQRRKGGGGASWAFKYPPAAPARPRAAPAAAGGGGAGGASGKAELAHVTPTPRGRLRQAARAGPVAVDSRAGAPGGAEGTRPGPPRARTSGRPAAS